MSEKNVHGSQWTKATTQKLNYDGFGTVAGLAGGISASLYGDGAAGLSDIPPQPPDGIQQTYANARFQHPNIHHVAAPPPPPTPSTVLLPLGASSSSVPAPSGFVPPSFITSGSANATSAATSVLTPNPFAVHSGNSNVAFGLEQFQHLNAQQQFEFTKMMTAMNTAAAAASLATATAGVAVTSINTMSPMSTSTPASSLAQQTAGRHHMDLATASGAITSTIAENVMNVINSNIAKVPTTGRAGIGVKVPDEDKMRRIQHVVESGIGDQAKQQIVQILDCISTLKPVEKLLLYLRMPGEAPETDPLRHPQNPLGTRSEINHTINWVRTHLEHDPQVSIPKQDVYNEYIAYCERLLIKPLSTADFGKVMKQVFPEIRPRRLGTRGHSRYCYAAMRKTTKLISPQLPQLGNNNLTEKFSGNESTVQTLNDVATAKLSNIDECQDASWNVIKLWAETMLNIKVNSMQSLATHIQTNNLAVIGGGASGAHAPYVPKKSQREPKEKRSIGDIGPLKKRRKKKRKGSSSSESSCNQPQQQTNAENSNNILSHVKAPNMSLKSEDEKKSIQLIEVKQEIIDSPCYQRIKRLASPQLQTASITTSFCDDNQKQQQQQHSYDYHQNQSKLHHGVQQLLPMNLATEPRTVLARAPSSLGGITNLPSTSTAVKNLTPKIMDLSSAGAITPSAYTVAGNIDQVPIKEEVVEDYNPTNIIYCKKVLKAQQTKGFWANSPTPSVNVAPTTTVTAASPPLSVIATTSAAATAAEMESSAQTSNYLMGPPAQITTSTSPSSASASASLTAEGSTALQPKVSSRNMMQLRAKKLRYYQMRESIANSASPGGDHHAGDSSADIDKDADLPENLGLPRERVISICNMDKHELDDYFLPGEEENSQDQEAELLQYFQTGDAEEKTNSLDAAKTTNPTATHLPHSNDYNHKQRYAAAAANSSRAGSAQTNSNKTPITTDHIQDAAVANAGVSTATAGKINMNTVCLAAAQKKNTPPTPTPAVGSASASLALMSQKHQQTQQQNKRKINLNAMAISKINKSNARKNCIFFPISPNINSAVPSLTTPYSATNGGGVLFASPGVTRFRPKPAALGKQQSLDCDVSSNSDPMIGASRRRKCTYGSTHASTLNSTSASAPPSPSILQQQKQQEQLFNMQQPLTSQWHLSSSAAYNDITNHAASLLADQNSLDLDLFDAAAGGANTFTHDSLLDAAAAAAECSVLTPMSETQRSQSVPLSQLQRSHSPSFNRNFQQNFSTCNSVAQTPVPTEFADFNLFSENSQHATGSKQHGTKLEPTGVLTSDTTAILDEVDVSEILSSPDFVAKFSNVQIVQTSNVASTTTCSSAGSSSGYSSGACTTFGGAAATYSMGSGIASRSVPSTPLPHQQQYLFGGSNFYERQRVIDEVHLSPTSAASSANTISNTSKYSNSQLLSRAAYDISKSMPTTPITTPCFRYSPTEFHRDFLINGNTIDSITSLPSMNVLGNDSFMNGGINADSLIDDGAGGVATEAFTTSAGDDDSTMVGADILDNL